MQVQVQFSSDISIYTSQPGSYKKCMNKSMKKGIYISNDVFSHIFQIFSVSSMSTTKVIDSLIFIIISFL